MLTSVHGKVQFALSMIGSARESAITPEGLWYHAVGMLNAFYAVREELFKTVPNGCDKGLKGIIETWRKENREKLDGFFGRARDIATHQGAVKVSRGVDWILLDYLDTVEPKQFSRITIKGTPITSMRGDAFLDVCEDAFRFLNHGLSAINTEYLATGGFRILPRTSAEETFDWLKGVDAKSLLGS